MNSKGSAVLAGLAVVGGSFVPGLGAEAAHAALIDANAAHISYMDMPADLNPHNPCVVIAAAGDSEYKLAADNNMSRVDFAQTNHFVIGKAIITIGNKYDICANNNDDIHHPLTAAASSTAPANTSTTSTAETLAAVVNNAANCPINVSNMGEVSAACTTLALSTLKGYGFVDNGNSRDIEAFQILSGTIVKNGVGYGKLGPKTYSEILSGDGIKKITEEANKILSKGVIIDKSDQTLVQLDNGIVVGADLISTGLSTSAENRETRVGSYIVDRNKNGWVRSSLQAVFADPAMYSPRYFSNGQAIHGTPAAQLWKLGTKASHGCVRTFEKFQDWLISHGLKNGSKVVVKP